MERGRWSQTDLVSPSLAWCDPEQVTHPVWAQLSHP